MSVDTAISITAFFVLISSLFVFFYVIVIKERDEFKARLQVSYDKYRELEGRNLSKMQEKRVSLELLHDSIQESRNNAAEKTMSFERDLDSIISMATQSKAAMTDYRVSLSLNTEKDQ
jgi:hypothetical protein